jgi:hypothetical protein
MAAVGETGALAAGGGMVVGTGLGLGAVVAGAGGEVVGGAAVTVVGGSATVVVVELDEVDDDEVVVDAAFRPAS